MHADRVPFSSNSWTPGSHRGVDVSDRISLLPLPRRQGPTGPSAILAVAARALADGDDEHGDSKHQQEQPEAYPAALHAVADLFKRSPPMAQPRQPFKLHGS
jgi:hypothetical protein